VFLLTCGAIANVCGADQGTDTIKVPCGGKMASKRMDAILIEIKSRFYAFSLKVNKEASM